MRFIALLLIFLTTALSAQENTSVNTEKEVVDVVKKMFDGMRASDTTMVRSAFHSQARMQTSFVDRKTGKPRLATGSLDKFLAALGKPHPEVWNEVIWTYDTKIDDNFASVWTEYTFYLDTTMSHCGINAFHLVNTHEGWKIIQITDTRRWEDCKTFGEGSLDRFH